MKPQGVWGVANETSGRVNVSFIGAKLRFSFETNKSFLKKVWKKLVGQSFVSVYTICWYFLFIDKRWQSERLREDDDTWRIYPKK
ncbi:hypothetical protein CFT61_05955 [Segatella copri]|uniref:Uncharacterized protein n=1 Tax=Segatella copri TaxID=165179 RepID=A0AA91TKU9_9BACT|nr:hypothetical protein CFT61_05955 [Segatella copri]